MTYSVVTGDSGVGVPATECRASFPPYEAVWPEDEELFVGPAIDLVGELALARVTVRGCPSHPVAESFPIQLSIAGRVVIALELGLTICSPCLFFIFYYNLTQSCGISVLVIVNNCLSDMKRSLADEVF